MNNNIENLRFAEYLPPIQRQTKTLSIKPAFSRAVASDGELPWGIFDSRFSRIVFALVDTGSSPAQNPSANVRISNFPDIFARTAYAFNKHMDAGSVPETEVSAAYTVKFATGPLKGKTPAQVLLEMEDGKALLNQQYKYLAQNAEKYPRNKVIMNAISEAAKLEKEGTLNKQTATSSASASIVIYDAKAHALIRNKKDNGMCPCHDITITYNVGAASPVNITIANYDAPVVVRDNGTISPIVSNMDKESLKKVSMDITAAEWNQTMENIKRAMRAFEVCNALPCLKDAVTSAKTYKDAHVNK